MLNFVLSKSRAFLLAGAVLPAQIFVCPDCDIKSINSAIQASKNGDQIIVQGGTYTETPILLNKSIQLIGKDGATLDAQSKGHVVVIDRANEVSIEGFIIQNSGMSYTEELAGIRVIEAKNCRIENNKLLKNTYGVYLEKSEGCLVRKNFFSGFMRGESDSGNGVHAWYGSGHQIIENELSSHRDGIYFEFISNTKVHGNDVHGNLRYGLHFMTSNKNEYTKNHFHENGAGVAVMYSRDILMANNRFSKNTGPAAYGLLLKDIYTSQIQGNSFESNTVGIFMEGSNRSKFTLNQLSSNGTALRIMADCENNEFRQNNFTRNTFEVVTNSTHSYNEFSDNYWSQYEGYDLNHDGVGDKPFRPVSLASIILERVDSGYVLLKSPFFSLLNEIERALPIMIPEALKDSSPRMTPIAFNEVSQ